MPVSSFLCVRSGGGLSASALRDPRSGSWAAFPPNTPLLASTAAVLQFARLARIIAALASRLLGIPTFGHSDDFELVTPPPLTEEALLAFTELNEISGLELELSKSERGQLPGFLGLAIDLSQFSHSPPLLFLSQAKKVKLKAQIAEILQSRRVSPATLRKLVGKLSLAQASKMAEIARATPRPLFLHSDSDAASRALFPSAGTALEWRPEALSLRGARVIRPITPPPDLILYTDGGGSGSCAALGPQAHDKDPGRLF